jgi:AcrR family transcriptional regulator
MSRTAGARNHDYAQQRKSLILKARERLSARETESPSFRELAAAAGVSVSTMRHYFGSRQDVISAVFEASQPAAAVHLDRGRTPSSGDLAESLREFLTNVARAWTHGAVGALHRIGLAEGLRSGEAGLKYLNDVLEPTLQALEQRLTAHIARGEMIDADTRHAALMLLSPVVLGLLHQHDLGGTRCRPLDLTTVVGAQVEVFVRAFGPRTSSN